MNLYVFLQNLSNGISLGFLFALIAIGYSMVYGILRLMNFAHSGVFMMAAFFVYYSMAIFSPPWWLACLIAVILAMLLGMIVEKVAYSPLRNAPRVSSLCSAIGMSFLLENLAVVLFGGRQKPFYQPEFFSKIFILGDVRIPGVNLVTPIVSIASLLILTYIVYKTKSGLAMRAVSRDFDTSKLMGISLNRTISITFIMASGLAAVGAILWSLRYPQIWPLMGVFPGWRAFSAAIIGGIGSIKGAMTGGFLLGIISIMTVAFMPQWAGYKDGFIFGILILVLLFKPEGLFGEDR
jgi:branched-chain amino acid transport system permease protein